MAYPGTMKSERNRFFVMNRIGGKIILWLLILSLIVFTAIRTLHFLELTFPPDLGYVAYLGLAAFDIGILGWFYFATQSAEGAGQRAIAYGMIFVCMTGVVITTVADMVIVSSQNGLTKLPPQWGTIGLWGVIIVIVLNVVAGIVVHLAAPEHARHLAMENARDRIHSTVLAHISAQADTIAPQIAAHTAQHWANQVIHEMTGSIPGSYNAPVLSTPKVVDADPPKNVPAISHNPVVKAASPEAVVDPHKVKPRVDAEAKSLEKPKSFGQILGNVHAGIHNAIDKRLDGSKSIHIERTEDEYSPEFEQALDNEIEKPAQGKKTTVFVKHDDTSRLEAHEDLGGDRNP